MREFARRAESTLGPCAIVLIGSYARGDFHAGSDIDVVVVARDLPERFVDRLTLLVGLVDAPIEPFPYTPDEFSMMKEGRHPTAIAVREDGVVVAGTID